jgi:hypothetical protein
MVFADLNLKARANWFSLLPVLLACVTASAAWGQANSSAKQESAHASVAASLRWWVDAVQSRSGYDGYSVPAGMQVLWITGGPLGLSRWALDEEDLVKSELRNSGWVEVKRLPAPTPTTQRSSYHLDPTSGTIYLHSYDRGLVVGELKADGTVDDVLHLRDERLNPLFHDQGAGRLLGNHRDGFWVLNNFSGDSVLIRDKRIEHVPGLSRKDESSPQVQYRDAISGIDNTVWVLKDNQRLQRINAQGRVLADSKLPFVVHDRGSGESMNGLSSYGDGRLVPSAAGVIVISGELQQIASFDHQGRLMWQRQLCKGEISYRCSIESARAGGLDRFAHAVGDAQGNALVGDGKRIFKLNAAQPTQIWGDTAKCDSDAMAAAARGSAVPFTPCYTHEFFAARVSPERHLLASSTDDMLHVFELNLSAGTAGTELKVKPYGLALEQMPPSERRQLWQAMRDQRHFVPPGGRGTFDSGPRAIQAAVRVGSQVFTTTQLGRGALHFSKPHAHDQHPLVYLDREPHSAASLGTQSVLVLHQDRNDNAAKLWRFDAASKKFAAQPVQLKAAGNPDAKGSTPVAITYIFNDSSGKTLARDHRDRIGEIAADLTWRPIATVPPPPKPTAPTSPACCGHNEFTPAGWGVGAAAQDTVGRWWLLVNGTTLMVQKGSVFVQAEIRDAAHTQARSGLRYSHIHQMFPGRADDMVVLTDAGIATVRVDRQ